MKTDAQGPVTSPDTYATNKTFADLGVRSELCDELARQGITTAFPIQAMTIQDALDGRDVCGKAKTGSGKTLGFGLPMLQRLAAVARPRAPGRRPARPRGLVLLPTRELAVQVHEVLKAARRGARAARQRRLRRRGHRAPGASLQKGCDVVIATPGRLIDLGDRGEVSVSRPGRARPRRGRPHGRHGLHAPGRVGPSPHRGPTRTRRCCSRRRSTARSTAW